MNHGIIEILGTLRKQVDNLTQHCQQANQEVAKLTEGCVHVEQSLHTEQTEAHNHKSQAKELEKQVILLTEQHRQVTTALRQAEDKIETLRHEKLFFVQEKAQLMGSLKQLRQFETADRIEKVST